jgi:hypothetical protein
MLGLFDSATDRVSYPNNALCRTPCLLHAIYYVINNYNVRHEIWVSRVWEL